MPEERRHIAPRPFTDLVLLEPLRGPDLGAEIARGAPDHAVLVGELAVTIRQAETYAGAGGSEPSPTEFLVPSTLEESRMSFSPDDLLRDAEPQLDRLVD